jgi:hypothetical protein
MQWMSRQSPASSLDRIMKHSIDSDVWLRRCAQGESFQKVAQQHVIMWLCCRQYTEYSTQQHYKGTRTTPINRDQRRVAHNLQHNMIISVKNTQAHWLLGVATAILFFIQESMSSRLKVQSVQR